MKITSSTTGKTRGRGLPAADAGLYRRIRDALADRNRQAMENLNWLYDNLHPYFFITMKEDIEAIICLATGLSHVPGQRKLTLLDHEKRLIVARLDIPGSLYETLKTLQEREISYAELTHSFRPIPGARQDLEIQKFEFDRKTHREIAEAAAPRIPAGLRKSVRSAVGPGDMRRGQFLYHPGGPHKDPGTGGWSCSVTPRPTNAG